MTDTTQTNENTGNNKPTHIARKRLGRGKNAGFETLGVAWERQDGSLYVKPYGTQIIEGGFYVFRINDADEQAA
ncbi:MAG: hypothetical protein H6843_00980 [Rhodospirillaceae bacterium]|nr:hypothetical protein [Rhodospirillaceae bacterium]